MYADVCAVVYADVFTDPTLFLSPSKAHLMRGLPMDYVLQNADVTEREREKFIQGDTLLHCAGERPFITARLPSKINMYISAKSECAPLIDLLVSRGCDVKRANRCGQTPMDVIGSCSDEKTSAEMAASLLCDSLDAPTLAYAGYELLRVGQ